jgi:hypothetical protein
MNTGIEGGFPQSRLMEMNTCGNNKTGSISNKQPIPSSPFRGTAKHDNYKFRVAEAHLG